MTTLLLGLIKWAAAWFDMKLGKLEDFTEPTDDVERLREATEETARDMFVIIATGGPRHGTFTPIPLPHVNAVPRYPPDEHSHRAKFSTPAPWAAYQEFVETIVPADRREVSGLVVPKSIAITLGYSLDTGDTRRRCTP